MLPFTRHLCLAGPRTLRFPQIQHRQSSRCLVSWHLFSVNLFSQNLPTSFSHQCYPKMLPFKGRLRLAGLRTLCSPCVQYRHVYSLPGTSTSRLSQGRRILLSGAWDVLAWSDRALFVVHRYGTGTSCRCTSRVSGSGFR